MVSTRPKVITPNYITHLSSCEVFVFGSNLAGHHHGGAARMAHEQFGAEWGVGVGPTGQCYAIPTMQGGIDTIRPYVDEFIKYAKDHPMNRFLVTRIGCGIAGFKDEQIAPLFVDAMFVPNITLPLEWKFIIDDRWMQVYRTSIHDEIKKQLLVEVPKVITVEVLQELCEKCLYRIGACYHTLIPPIEIRYVIDIDKFGYACFGDFFFYQGNLYVFESDEKYKDEHNAGVVWVTFHDECEGHGYAHEVIFAGVRTSYKDVNGDYIYTGDAVMTDRLGLDKEHIYGVRALDFWGDYGFMLDNHCLGLGDCSKIVRVGTVLFDLSWDEMDMLHFVERGCNALRDIYGGGPTGDMNLRHVRFTPNFFKSEMEYIVMDNIRDDDFNWRK